MEEQIDYGKVIHQLQLENEMLRSYMKTFTEVRETIYKVPTMLESMWQKVTANKMRMLIGLMIIYSTVNIVFMLYDRFKGM